MTKVIINLVEFDPHSTYCSGVTLSLARVEEIEADLRGYVLEIDEDRDIDDAIDSKLYNITGLEIRQVSYTQV